MIVPFCAFELGDRPVGERGTPEMECATWHTRRLSCSRCYDRPQRAPDQRYCKECHAAAMREHRARKQKLAK